MYPKSIQKLIDLFSKFPTVGPRTAGRFVFYLLKLPKEEIKNLISAVADLKKEIKICKSCFNPFDPIDSAQGKDEPFGSAQGKGELCKICRDNSRDKTLLCIVEKETDLVSLEKIKKYKGLYFILGGMLSFLTTKKKGSTEGITKLRIKELEERIKNRPEIQEIIIAINPTAEGEATTLYLERLLKPLTCGEQGRTKKITRLGRGLALGAELEYSDEETLSSALESRR